MAILRFRRIRTNSTHWSARHAQVRRIHHLDSPKSYFYSNLNPLDAKSKLDLLTQLTTSINKLKHQLFSWTHIKNMIFNNINMSKSNQIITKNIKTLFDSKLHLKLKSIKNSNKSTKGLHIHNKWMNLVKILLTKRSSSNQTWSWAKMEVLKLEQQLEARRRRWCWWTWYYY